MPSATGTQPAAQRRPLVELLTTSNCPHRDAALALVWRVCGQLDDQAEVRVVEVPNQAAAEQTRSGFLGSPTIRVNGRDIEPGAEHNHEFVHGCRLYRGEHSLRGLPEEAWLCQALQDAQALP
jgi:glutaredoxin